MLDIPAASEQESADEGMRKKLLSAVNVLAAPGPTLLSMFGGTAAEEMHAQQSTHADLKNSGPQSNSKPFEQSLLEHMFKLGKISLEW